MEFTLATVGRKRLLVPVPWTIAKIMGTVMGYLPGAPLTADQVELLKTDSVVSEAASNEGRDLASLGIKGQGIQGIVPSYLYRYRKAGQFTAPKGMPE
jgi:NADH dehydrogenase